MFSFFLRKTDLSFQRSPLPGNDSELIAKYLSTVSIQSVKPSSIEEYHKQLDDLINENISYKSEFDYLLMQKNRNKNLSQIEKMKIIGKIGETPTILDKASFQYEATQSFDGYKVYIPNNFFSFRTNNCFTSGKWCYEVQLITNGLFQLGWCTLQTPFTSMYGVGDDKYSYAIDGWRKVKFNLNDKEYGTLWDIGDVIGVCIDLDEKFIEYYHNGNRLGIAHENIQTGQNYAYFPGASISNCESCTFNFGQMPMIYNYKDYKPLDVLHGELSGTLVITAQMCDTLKHYLLPFLLQHGKNMSPYSKQLISYQIFSYIRTHAIKDLMSLKTIIFPFIQQLDQDSFNIFWEGIMSIEKNNNDYFLIVFDKLSNLIEEAGLRGTNGIDEWKYLFKIFTWLIQIKPIAKIWINYPQETINEHLNAVLNTNNFYSTEYYEFIQNELKNKPDLTIAECMGLMEDYWKQNHEIKHANINEIYSEQIANLLDLLNTDYTNRSNTNQVKSFNSIFIEFLNSVTRGTNVRRLKQLTEDKIAKNIIFNFIYLTDKKLLNEKFENFDTSYWIDQNKRKELYRDEIGIGGSFNQCKIYESYIPSSLKFYSLHTDMKFWHKIITMFHNKVTLEILNDYMKNKKKMKLRKMSSLLNVIQKEGSTEFINLIRRRFDLFNLHSQKLLYTFSFYLVKYYIWLMSKSKHIFYFIPQSAILLPYNCFHLLLEVNSRIFDDTILRKDLNSRSKYFSNDDYIESIITYTAFLFNQENVSNPDVILTFLENISYILTKSESYRSIFFKNPKILFDIFVGLINTMEKPRISHFSCQVLLDIVLRSCFGYSHLEMTYPVPELKNFLKEKRKILAPKIFKTFFQCLNKQMSFFTMYLSTIEDKYQSVTNKKLIDYTELIISFNSVADYLCLLEFLFQVYPEELFNNECDQTFSLLFMNLLKNLSARMLANPFKSQIEKFSIIIDTLPPNANGIKRKMKLYNLYYPTFGILNILMNSQQIEGYNNFIQKVLHTDDLPLESFIEFTKFASNPSDRTVKPTVEKIRKYLCEMNKNKQVEDTLTNEEKNKLIQEDKLCILCYNNETDVQIVPCLHVACHECMNIYRQDKNICFICHGFIEKVVPLVHENQKESELNNKNEEKQQQPTDFNILH